MKSENLLLGFAVVALIVSVLSVGVNYYSILSYKPYSFTGFVTSSPNATVNLTIVSNAAINFSIKNISFGSGNFLPGTTQAVLTTTGANNTNGTWVNVTTGLVLENIGNVNLTLWIVNTKNATAFTGASSFYQLNVTNNEVGSCNNRSGFPLGFWYDANSTNGGTGNEGMYVCSNFSYVDSGDSVRIDFKIIIPYTIANGALSDTIMASAYAT